MDYMHHTPPRDLGPPPPYTREAVRPSRSVPNLRQQLTIPDFPGIGGDGRLRSPSPTPEWEARIASPSHYGHHQMIRRSPSPQIYDENSDVPERRPQQPPRPALVTAPSVPNPQLPDGATQKEKNVFKSAFDETVFFASGLLPHPTESNRHYTILRHSSALVWYRGPSTTVTITIFSDAPLPATRSLWLQRKGYSGNTGMALKSLVGATTSWIEVTPHARAEPASLPPNDERAYQRDMAKFARKASGSLKKHIARETHVVRIPAAAEDGYFRLMLCCGDDAGKKKTLCPSPVFRVASTSTDASVVRGASLSTMPVEFGVKVGTTIATTVANKYIGPARLAATAAAAGAARKVEKKGVLASRAREVALAKATMRSGYGKMEARYKGTRGTGYAPLQASEADLLAQTGLEGSPEVIGPDEGPLAPFPLKFTGQVVKGTGRSGMEFGIPTANLSGVREDLRLRMAGTYMAWACVLPREHLPETMSYDWHESLVTVAPVEAGSASVVARNQVVVHLIHEFSGAMFYDAKVKVLVMGQLRRAGAEEDRLAAYVGDVLITAASLSREAWGPIETEQRMQTLRSERTFAERYIDARDKVQKQVDRVPLHWVGVRSDGMAMRDQAIGHGGVWVQR